MKNKFPIIYALVLFGFLGNDISAQTIVKNLDVSPEETKIQMDEETSNYFLLEIGGPGNYYWKQDINETRNISLSNVRADGQKFPDGTYTLQITPIIKLSDVARSELRTLDTENNEDALTAFREHHNLPAKVNIFTGYFSIRNGKFVPTDVKEERMRIPSMSSKWEMDHPAAYASVEPIRMNYNARPLAMDNSFVSEDDQVILDDLIVDGSICVGFDCVNGESFGFDTMRLKENNLRIKFQDTSSSASFPTNDWQITANDTSNGGANKFSIDDIDHGRTPFTIEAGAPSHSLYVDDGGRIGLGTATPVVEVHVKDGDTPTMRLEQDGTSGFTQQTWDVAGNETNFFIRDATNGSTLPFRIRPGAPSSAIDIAASGNVGIGTASPNSALHINDTGAMTVPLGDSLQRPSGVEGMLRGNNESNEPEYFDGTSWISLAGGGSGGGSDQWGESGNNLFYTTGNVGIGVIPTTTLDVLGNVKITGNPTITGTSLFRGSTIVLVDGVNERVGIGTPAPGHQLELSQDDAVKPNGGSWTAPSDRRLKTDIKDYSEGLDAVLKIRPVKFHYNGKLGMPAHQEFIGVVAQDMQEIAPYTVKKLNYKNEGGPEYLAFDPAPVTYMLVNAVKEQQAIIENQQKEIDELKNKLDEYETLKSQLVDLSEVVGKLKKDLENQNEERSSSSNNEKE